GIRAHSAPALPLIMPATSSSATTPPSRSAASARREPTRRLSRRRSRRRLTCLSSPTPAPGTSISKPVATPCNPSPSRFTSGGRFVFVSYLGLSIPPDGGIFPGVVQAAHIHHKGNKVNHLKSIFTLAVIG